MSRESYVRGFRKAAEAMGIDPGGLAKFATGLGSSSSTPQPVASHSVSTNATPRYESPIMPQKTRSFSGALMEAPLQRRSRARAQKNDKARTDNGAIGVAGTGVAAGKSI